MPSSVVIPQPNLNLTGSRAYHLVSAATTNLTLVNKGQTLLTGWALTNTSAALSYIVFHDIDHAPQAGTEIYFKFGIPTVGAANVPWQWPIQFLRGMAFSTVTGAADTNTTAVAANDLLINLFYR